MSQPPNSPSANPSIVDLRRRVRNGLPGAMGIEIVALGPGTLTARLTLSEEHLATGDYLHAGAVVTLNDHLLKDNLRQSLRQTPRIDCCHANTSL